MKSSNLIKGFNIGIILLLMFTTGCYYDQVYVAPPEGDISYSTDMQPFFDLKCTSCHNGTGVPLDLTAGGSYDALINGNYINTANASESLLYTKIDTGGSMESYATDAERAITLKWIEQGAKNN